VYRGEDGDAIGAGDDHAGIAIGRMRLAAEGNGATFATGLSLASPSLVDGWMP